MPQRQSAVRVDSTAVQGEGSYVVLRKLTVGEIRGLRKTPDSDQYEIGEELIRSRIVEWNWCDENGESLAQVHDDPAVFDSVTDDEFVWLANAIKGSETDRKN